MASSFGLFNTAYSGLAAARAALEVTGENVSNVNTPGYTRQRVDQVSLAGSDLGLRTTTGLNIGQGTKISGIARLSDAVVDARVRDTTASDGYWSAQSSALSSVDTSLGEPGTTGISSTLTAFWNAWQAVGTSVGSNGSNTTGAMATLLNSAQTLTSRISSGYSTAATQWQDALTTAKNTVTAVNQAGKTVATLNDQILRIEVAGGSANELKDQRDTALTTLANLTGASTRQNANGTIDVLVGGSTFVSGTSSRTLEVGGAGSIAALDTSTVTLQFSDRAGTAVQLDGGSLAGRLSALAPAGSGGVYASAAKAYNDVATSLRTTVNTVHRTGVTGDGTTNADFFGTSGAGAPAALSLTVPTSAAKVALGMPGAGARDGSLADKVGQLQHADGGPDTAWSAFVTGIGARAQAASTQATVATSAATAASTARTSQNGVDLDEETANLVVFQHAYQGAARVLTAVDEMLDTLINRTGLVGRS